MNTKSKRSKKILCIILSMIIGFGTFVSMTFGNLFLSDYIDFKNLITAKASTSDVKYYHYGNLVGLYNIDYTSNETLQYKIGDNGTWKNYVRPFAVTPFETVKIYGRVGTNGTATYYNETVDTLAFGTFTEVNTDLELRNNGVSFAYTRTYDSKKKAWFESVDSRVYLMSAGLARLYLPDGTMIQLPRVDENTYVDEITGKSLVKDAKSGFYIYEDDDYTYKFYIGSSETTYYLRKVLDKNGNTIDIRRALEPNAIVVMDTNGRRFTVPKITTSNNTSMTSFYATDTAGNQIEYKAKDCVFYEVTDQSGVKINEYTYDSNMLLESTIDKNITYYYNNRVQKVTALDGSYTSYGYSNAEKKIRTTVSGCGNTYTYYNNAIQPIKYVDEYGEETAYTYNSKYQLTKEECGGETTTYTYSNYKLSTSVTKDEENTVIASVRYQNGLPVREQNEDCYTYYAYDSKGNMTVSAELKEDYEGDIPLNYDSALTCFDTVCYTYDSKGRVTSEVYPKSGSVLYEYDNSGNVTKKKITDYVNDNAVTKIYSYTYDLLGNLLTTQCNDDVASKIYDAAGRVLLFNDNGLCTRTLYDDKGRVIQEIQPEDYDSAKDGLPNSNTYSDANVGHRYVYNETTGNLEKETNRLGVTTEYEYFDTGEKKSEEYDIYKFCYNINGDLTKTYVKGVNTLSYNYDEDYNLTSEVYANGQSIRYEYDDNGNCVRQYHNNDISAYVIYSYNADNELTQKINTDTGLKHIYGADGKVDVYRLFDNTLVQSYTETVTEADEENNVEAKTEVTETHFGTTYASVIKDDSILYTTGNDSVEYSYTETDNNSITSDSIKFNNATVISSNYEYDSNNNITSKALSYDNTISVKNTYDNKFRVKTIGCDGPQIYYSYGDSNQLVRSDNDILDYSFTFTYNDRGNILTKNKYAYTKDENISTSPAESTVFTYADDGWNDKLIAVNGTPLTYDANGNVLTYGDKSFMWSSGRNLAQITDGDNTYSYTYDESGIRTSKTINGITTYFNTRDGVILSQTDGTNTMYFQYDTNGSPFGFIYKGTQYLYLTNQMGDVISITDTQGNKLVQYEYDEWGAIGSIITANNTEEETALAYINPLRYRGYYYDNETGYYYLQSRYYDASICRFINADDLDFLNKENHCGTNLFAYCGNDSINKYDPSGHFIILIVIATIVTSISIRNILSDYNSEEYFEVSKKDKKGYGKKGVIVIDLENHKRFCDDIYEAMKLSSDQTFSLLAQYAASIFKKARHRNFLFNNESIADEIEFHVRGWLFSKNYSDIELTDDMQYDLGHVAAMFVTDYLKDHCRKVDIIENDAYDSKQKLFFGYYSAVREGYLKTKKDPYYNTKTRKRSSSYVSSAWKKLSF